MCSLKGHHEKIIKHMVNTLSPIIMEVENHPKRKEPNIGGTHFSTSMIMGGRVFVNLYDF